MNSFLARTDPEHAARFAQQDLSSIDNATLVNALSNAFPLRATEKQHLLNADAIAERLDRLMGVLEFRLTESGSVEGASPKTIH